MRFRLYFLLPILIASCAPKTENRPNVLFIMMDDLGYGQIGLYNEELSTDDFDPCFVSQVKENENYNLEEALEFSRRAMPTMHSLAEEGVLFTRAFTSSSLCAPSRIGIATATLQNRMGIYRNVDCEQKGIQPNTHLAEIIICCLLVHL